MPTGQIADSCVLWTGFDISIVARNYAQLAGVIAGFASLLVAQSAALSLQTGVEVAYVELAQPLARASS